MLVKLYHSMPDMSKHFSSSELLFSSKSHNKLDHVQCIWKPHVENEEIEDPMSGP